MDGLRIRSLVVALVLVVGAAAWVPAGAAGPCWWPWFPCPSPSPAPAVAPAASPSPGTAASPSPAPSVAPSRSPGSAPASNPPASGPPSAPAPAPVPSPSPSPSPVTLPPAVPGEITLTAASLQIGLVESIAIKSIATPSGPQTVIELVVASSTIGGLDLLMPCVAHERTHITAGQARATGGLTLDLRSLQVTLAGITITISVTSPPSLQLMPPAGGSFLSAKMQLLSIRSGAMALDQPLITSSSC